MKRILLLCSLLFSTLLFSKTEKDSLEQLLSTMNQDTNRVQLLIRMSKKYDANDQKQARIYLNEALALSKKLKFKDGQANSLIKLSVIDLETDQYEHSDSCLREARKIAEVMKDTLYLGVIYNNFGMLYYDKYDYALSLENYFKAVDLFERVGNESKLTSSLNNIANIYFTQKLFDKALEYHLRSLEISRRVGQPSNIASSLNNLGLVYREKKDYKKAMEYFREALKIAIEVNHKVGQALLWNNIGKCQRITGNYEEALKSFNEALKLKEQMGDKNGMAHSYNNMADAYFDLKQYNKAIEYNLRSIDASDKTNNIGALENAYQSLSMAYSELKDYKNAYTYHMMFSELKDSLFNVEKSEQLAEMSTRFETEKKDKDLVKKDAEIKVKEIESKQKETQRNAFVIGFVLVAIMALFIFKGLKDKQKANSKLSVAYDEIDLKNKIVEEKNKNITDSINYAKRIQSALLASDNLLNKNLSDHFIFYKPKDIVSGDFYWAHKTNTGDFLICTGDCTGHGVPGAFMSLLGISSLNEISIEKQITQPDTILNLLRERIVNVLNPEGAEQKSYDGMDCSICKYNFGKMELEFAAANNGLWIVSENGALTEYKPDKQPVGFHSDSKPFNLNKVKLKKGDTVYTFTDGYADQFGGPKGKKFKYKQVQELLCANSHKPLKDQKEALMAALSDWQGKLEQIDDILIIGIKV